MEAQGRSYEVWMPTLIPALDHRSNTFRDCPSTNLEGLKLPPTLLAQLPTLAALPVLSLGGRGGKGHASEIPS